MPEQSSLQTLLVLCVLSPETRGRVEQSLGALGHGERSTGGVYDFSIESVPDVNALGRRLDTLAIDPSSAHVIVISDRLTVGHGSDAEQPSELAGRIRETLRPSRHLCGLVALVPGVEHRIPDIDHAVTVEEFDPERLNRAVTKTATGLWMKSPPAVRVPGEIEGHAIQVQVVRSEEEMAKCLALRFQVYDLMSYLAEDISKSGASVEMDSFDISSIHFIATDARSGEIAGTARLVLQEVPRYLDRSIVGAPLQTLNRQAGWCRSIAAALSTDAFLRRIERPYFTSLPILQSSDFKEAWPAMLEEAAKGGELSRVVAAPRYRGLGVSRLLVRIAIATALDLGKEFLLLECIPTHAKMYAQYGFELLEGHHCRAQELDQVAVGMRLDLHGDGPHRAAAALARRDVAMLACGASDAEGGRPGKGFLCLCQRKACWREARYEWRGTRSCPLLSRFEDNERLTQP